MGASMILKNTHLTRQADLIPCEVLGEKITIIGAGAIGSWTALALAKMGFGDITVYDHDTIEMENMNSQFYPRRDVGRLKVDALADLVRDFTGTSIYNRAHKYTGHNFNERIFPGIVISAVDSMEVRKLVWDNHKNKSPGTKAIIDPRMGAETALLYVMNPMDAKDQSSYEKSLYSDASAVQERCTAKATIYTANMLSGLVCKAVKDLVTSKPNYLRSAQWAIADDAFQAYQQKLGV
jgi:molybdopterin/thiamine biosynthesis adenylyltransferase